MMNKSTNSRKALGQTLFHWDQVMNLSLGYQFFRQLAHGRLQQRLSGLSKAWVSSSGILDNDWQHSTDKLWIIFDKNIFRIQSCYKKNSSKNIWPGSVISSSKHLISPSKCSHCKFWSHYPNTWSHLLMFGITFRMLDITLQILDLNYKMLFLAF